MNPLEIVLRHRWVQSAVALLVCATGIWLGGRYLALGDYRPLASAWVRALLILALVVFWGVVLWIMERRQAGAASEGKRAFRDRLVAVTSALRRRGQQELPRYLLLGAEGSGRSSWLVNAGFETILARSERTTVPAMPSCDWWSDGRIVMLVPEVGPVADDGAWPWLLDHLKQRRRRYVIGGVVVTHALGAAMPDAGVRELSVVLRSRLDDLRARVGDVPVYVLATKTDRVAGFLECFQGLDDERRSQVWGMTFPLDHDDLTPAGTRFDAAFEALAMRLDGQLTERLHAASNPRESRRLFGFSQQLRCHAAGMREFVEVVLGARPYGHAPRFRGFYFVSSIQDGATVDYVSPVVEHAFGVRGSLHSSNVSLRRSYFLGRLVEEVWVPESGLARGTGRTRRRWVRWAMSGGIVLSGLLAFLALLAGYRSHVSVAGDMDRTLHELKDPSGVHPPASYREYYGRVLERLDVLDRAERMVSPRAMDGSFMAWLGLSRADELVATTQRVRRREIGHNLMPGLFGQFRESLETHAREPRRLYFALKGYLMLSSSDHRQPDEMDALARNEWRDVFPHADGLVAALASQLRRYRVDAEDARVFTADTHVMEAARSSLKAADVAQLVYTGLKLDADAAGRIPLRLDRTLGLLGDTFRRRSGAPLSEPLASLHTREGFRRMTGGERDGQVDEGEIARAVAQFSRDAWVFGESDLGLFAKDDLYGRVMDLYIADYIGAWDNLLGDLELQPVANLGQAGAMAIRLSGPASPLRALLILLREQTEGLGERGASVAEHFAPLNQLTQGQPGMLPIDRVAGTLEQVGRYLGTVGGAGGEQGPVLVLARQEAANLPRPLSGWMDGLLGASQTLAEDGREARLRLDLHEAAGMDCQPLTANRYPFVADSVNDIPVRDFSRLFGRGGRFDTFALNNPPPASDERDAQGNASARDKEVMATMRLAQEIRETYFRDEATPAVKFTLAVDQLPEGVSRVVIEMDGQSYAYARDEFPAPIPMVWPGPRPGLTRIQIWNDDGEPLHGLNVTGEWSWFHALDAAMIDLRTETRFGVTFMLDGRQLVLGVDALSLHHPFASTAVHRFRCPP